MYAEAVEADHDTTSDLVPTSQNILLPPFTIDQA
jgi:hypothetical protein